MPIKNSFSVLLCNFKLVGKILFFILIIMLIASAVLMSIASPVLKAYFQKMQEEAPVSADEFLKHPIKSMERFLDFFIEFTKENPALVNTRVLFLILTLVISRFLLFLPMLPVTKILHQKMTTGFDAGLTNAFVNTLWQNLLFGLVFSIVIGLADIGILIGLVYLTSWLMSVIKILALPIGLLLALVIFSFRMTLFCQWLPEYFRNEPKNVFLSLGDGFKTCFKGFGKNYICIFVMTTVGFTLMSVSFLPTFGLMPALLVPTFMVFHSALCLCLNYSYHKHKYFTDNGVTVYNPIKKVDL